MSPHPIDGVTQIFCNPVRPAEFTSGRTSLWVPGFWAFMAIAMLIAGLSGGYSHPH